MVSIKLRTYFVVQLFVVLWVFCCSGWFLVFFFLIHCFSNTNLFLYVALKL